VFQAALGMCAVVLAARWGLMDAGVDGAARLVTCIAAGVVAFVPLCAWRVPEVGAVARDLLRRRRGGASAALAAPAGP
jgi:hypothetical protein